MHLWKIVYKSSISLDMNKHLPTTKAHTPLPRLWLCRKNKGKFENEFSIQNNKISGNGA